MAVTAAVLAFGAFFTDAATRVFERAQTFLLDAFGGFLVLVTAFFLGFVVWLAVGPFGHVRLGPDDSKPEFSYAAWFAMLFSAGMGIGLVFFGVAEPVAHYASPPLAEPGTPAAVEDAFRFAFFHWGLHPWAIYALFALALAFAHYRHGLPLAPRSLLHPVLGERVHGPVGHAVDVVAIVGTVFGLATSLGYGTTQVTMGLSLLAGETWGTGAQLLVLFTITAAAVASVVLGVRKGIKRLSNFNMVLAAALLAFIIVAGPTRFILDRFAAGAADYAVHVVPLSVWSADGDAAAWQGSWTLVYWAWWIAWAPFVGTFIARVSRGRTIREFVAGVLLVPALVGFLWFAALGGAALDVTVAGDAGIVDATDEDEALALYALLARLPAPSLTAAVATLLVAVFFVTSADSGALVIDTIANGGNPNPPRLTRALWATSVGAVAAVLLLAGGLNALQTAALTAGLPVAALMVIVAWSLVVALRRDAAASRIVP